MTSSGMIVVGSGPAGVSAAEAFRQHNSADSVLVLTDDPALPYSRPPLSKDFLRGDAEVDDIGLHRGRWFDERAIELVASGGVKAIDTCNHSVTANGKSYPYRWLVLACGAKPSPFPVSGAEKAAAAVIGRRTATARITTNDGRIVVDAQMRTSAENIYAAGDVALAHNSHEVPRVGRRVRALSARRPR